MALLSALFSALARKLSDVLQAIFGWSVAALFGRLTKKKQILVTLALVLSILWPLFVVGVFFPSAATFVIAFVPIDSPTIKAVLRVVWIVLAIVAPIGVGLLTRMVAPSARSKSVISSALHGYPMAIGFAGSFFVTVVTVPLVKLGSLVKRWSDQHLVVQPKKGETDAALHDICEAVAWTGLEPELIAVPRRMALATKVVKFCARGALDELMSDDPKMIRAEGLELYLYPGDLLIRGEPHAVSRVRACLGRTHLERDAYLVGSADGQRIQDDLGKLWEAIDRHHSAQEAGPGLESRLKEIVAETEKVDIPYEDWVMLDRIARKLEQRLVGSRRVIESKQLAEVAPHEEQVAAPALDGPVEEASAAQLITAALKESRELARIELKLAKAELTQELKAAKKSAIGIGVAVVFAILGLALAAVAIVFVAGATAAAAGVVSSVLLAVAAAAGLAGYSALPKKPLERTRRHLNDDYHRLKEHLA
jgi:uncharacterized membrane protein YqjE